jgi:hypothetical protein
MKICKICNGAGVVEHQILRGSHVLCKCRYNIPKPPSLYDKNIHDAIKAVVDYLEHDEKRDYEQHNKPPKNHIWHSVKLLKDAIR